MVARTSWASTSVLQCTMASSAYRSNRTCGYFAAIHRSKAVYGLTAPLAAQYHRHVCDAQLAGGLQAQMTIYDLTVAAGEYRDLEPELADRRAHAIHDRIVLARVANVENEFVKRGYVGTRLGEAGHVNRL